MKIRENGGHLTIRQNANNIRSKKFGLTIFQRFDETANLFIGQMVCLPKEHHTLKKKMKESSQVLKNCIHVVPVVVCYLSLPVVNCLHGNTSVHSAYSSKVSSVNRKLKMVEKNSCECRK